ncbi:hypothetical protein CEUSTIGMA_g526.t1 [Chlamydomonas eustigma]|uniref:Gamma-butyrobetaine hydroxylase-like N-terminal domain-containing protein n=1 Tax=Chlamydomonas eustigma TaxID=1157962 RepID=A0A250WQH5_9CHLO|nr:hypothetical protein CEUSTIGMA_g526.t1 [Chlamydomonas eustigma]|eukprot:GAX73073.1 hypothetical protein CEUSTIGMA_g526.t1 [Chlamydomonas eustigma]
MDMHKCRMLMIQCCYSYASTISGNSCLHKFARIFKSYTSCSSLVCTKTLCNIDISPSEIKLLKSTKRLNVTFDDGKEFSFSAEYLRAKSPSVDNARRDAVGLKVVAGRKHVGIMKIEAVGKYAIRLIFDDLHASGIYTWPYLYDLGLNKMQYSRRYIQALKARGLSREPSRRPVESVSLTSSP